MSCVLRITAPHEVIEQLVQQDFVASPIVLDKGVNIPVSDADLFDHERQIQDALIFLNTSGEEISDFCSNYGLESPRLDFAFALTGNYVQGFTLPADLLSIAGNYGMDIEVSLYPVSDEQ